MRSDLSHSSYYILCTHTVTNVQTICKKTNPGTDAARKVLFINKISVFRVDDIVTLKTLKLLRQSLLRAALNLLQTAGADEHVRVGIGTAELVVEDHRLFTAAFLQEERTELVGHLWIPETIALPELEGILVQDLCPEVAVVASAVTAAESMVEIRAAVTWDNLADETFGQCKKRWRSFLMWEYLQLANILKHVREW